MAEIFHYSGSRFCHILLYKVTSSNYSGTLDKDNIDFAKAFDELLFLDVLTARSESGMELFKMTGDYKSLVSVITDTKKQRNWHLCCTVIITSMNQRYYM